MTDPYLYGYPHECNDCASIGGDPGRSLKVAPYLREGTRFRLMLVGQDPTVRRRPERVKHVLMLDQPNGQLSRWLRGLFNPATFDRLTIYATNVVKCSFSKPPSDFEPGGLAFLTPYANTCRQHLVKELSAYQPDLVMTLGEPSHKVFRLMLDQPDVVGEEMKDAFTGSFVRASVDGFEFDYTPCLHIQTFRVAETYGQRVNSFKEGLANRLAQV
jgi:uracil-DNA glycosylase